MSSKKKALFLFGIFSIFVFLVMSGASAESDSSTPVKKQRPAVAFTHEDHMGGYECLRCHHRYEDGDTENNVLDEDELTDIEPDEVIMLNSPESGGLSDIKCASCHNEDNDQTKIDSREAFHRQCIGCHEEEKQGPVLCGECHVRSTQAASDEE